MSRNRTPRHFIVLASLALGSISASVFAGPVVGITEARSIHVAIPSIVEAEPAIDQTVTAPSPLPFNAMLDQTQNQLEQTNHAFASQDSSFGETAGVWSIDAAGQTRYSATGVSGIVFAESDFLVNFTLDDTRTFNISGSGSFVDTSGGASNFAVTLTGPGGEVLSFTKADFNPNLNDGAVVSPTFSTSGTLTPGNYVMTATSGVSGGTNINEVQASFDFNFTATAESTPPNPIPLPAGVWTGGAMLVGLGTLAARKRLQLAA